MVLRMGVSVFKEQAKQFAIKELLFCCHPATIYENTIFKLAILMVYNILRNNSRAVIFKKCNFFTSYTLE